MSLEVVHWEKKFPSSKKLYFFSHSKWLPISLSISLFNSCFLFALFLPPLSSSLRDWRPTERERESLSSSSSSCPPVWESGRGVSSETDRQTDIFQLGQWRWRRVKQQQRVPHIYLLRKTYPTYPHIHTQQLFLHTYRHQRGYRELFCSYTNIGAFSHLLPQYFLLFFKACSEREMA